MIGSEYPPVAFRSMSSNAYVYSHTRETSTSAFASVPFVIETLPSSHSPHVYGSFIVMSSIGVATALEPPPHHPHHTNEIRVAVHELSAHPHIPSQLHVYMSFSNSTAEAVPSVHRLVGVDGVVIS